MLSVQEISTAERALGKFIEANKWSGELLEVLRVVKEGSVQLASAEALAKQYADAVQKDSETLAALQGSIRDAREELAALKERVAKASAALAKVEV